MYGDGLIVTSHQQYSQRRHAAEPLAGGKRGCGERERESERGRARERESLAAGVGLRRYTFIHHTDKNKVALSDPPSATSETEGWGLVRFTFSHCSCNSSLSEL